MHVLLTYVIFIIKINVCTLECSIYNYYNYKIWITLRYVCVFCGRGSPLLTYFQDSYFFFSSKHQICGLLSLKFQCLFTTIISIANTLVKFSLHCVIGVYSITALVYNEKHPTVVVKNGAFALIVVVIN